MDLSNEINGKNIFLQNGFRIFNLPITAKPNKINNEFSKIEAMKNLNDLDDTESLDVYNNLPFPIDPKPNFLDYQNAKNRLSKPRMRFIDEVFWFWPEDLNNKKDETVRALKKGDVDSALSIWNSSTASNASHNLAVYNHVKAVDSEINSNTSLSQSYWKEALSQWYKTLSSNDFKNLALERVQQLNDPTVKQDYLEDIFTQLPVAVLSINASFANDYYKQGNKSEFGRHIDLIKDSDFDKSTKDLALKDIFDSLYDSLNEKHEEFGKQDYDKQSDMPKIERFLASIDDEITVLKEYFNEEYQFQMLSDNIAKSVMVSYVRIVNNMDSYAGLDFEKMIRVFKGLIDMAYTPTAKAEIEENLEQLDIMMKSSGDEKIHKRIISFLDDVENETIVSAKKYSRDIQSELDNSSSPNKSDLSDIFALSLDNFVVTQINKYGSDIEKILRIQNDLEGLLTTARRYATSTETKNKIDEDMKFFTETLPEAGKNMEFIKALEDAGVDLSNLSSSQSSSSSSTSSNESSGGGKGGTILCIIIIIIIFAAVAYFLGFI